MAGSDDGRTRKQGLLEEALDAELLHFERVIVRVWLWFGAIGIVGSLLLAAAVDPNLGLSCAVLLVPYLGWFTLYNWRLGRSVSAGCRSRRRGARSRCRPRRIR